MLLSVNGSINLFVVSRFEPTSLVESNKHHYFFGHDDFEIPRVLLISWRRKGIVLANITSQI